jgi:Tol biopolymer transport system component
VLGASPIDPESDSLLENHGSCDWPSLSDDLRWLAFSSYSENLVAGAANHMRDIFVRDRLGQSFEVASIDDSGSRANGDSRRPSISADGRYVAFESWASNLVPGDTNKRRDIFVRDRLSGTTTRVSVSSSGVQSNGDSANAAISANGRYVAFESTAKNLDPAARNGLTQVYVRDLVAGTTRLVSKVSASVAGNDQSVSPSISGDGVRVAFQTFATNLISMDANGGVPDVLVHDLASGAFLLANVDQSGKQGMGFAIAPAISRNGKRVAFASIDALHPADGNGVFDTYVRDLDAGNTLAAGTDASGAFSSRVTHAHSLSSDGHYVVFLSAAESFVPGDTGGWVDVFRKDLVSGNVELISVSSAGAWAAGNSGHPWISPDGDVVVFTCRDDALTPGDVPDGCSDIYLRQVLTGTTELETGGS